MVSLPPPLCRCAAGAPAGGAEPEQATGLHQRASRWYEQNGFPPAAIRHALAAGDFERAAGLIELAWPEMEASVQAATWLGWVKKLPDELLRARPVLSVGYAFALFGSGEMEAAEARLTDAERWLEPADNVNDHPQAPPSKMVVVDEEQFRSLPVAIATGRAYHAQALGDVRGTVKYAQRVLNLAREDDHLRRGQAAMLLGLAYWADGDLEAADRIFAQYTMKLRTAGNIPDAIGTTFVLAHIRVALGHLHEAASTLEQLLQFALDQGEPIPPDAADLYRGLGELYCEWGDLETAAQHLLRSKELGVQTKSFDWQHRLCVAQARLKQTKGDLDGALDQLDEAERLFIRTPLPDVRPISALKARIWVAQGRLSEAEQWARERGLAVDDAPSYMREFEHITLARVLIARHKGDRGAGSGTGSIDEAIDLLERLLHAAAEAKRMGSVIEILALLALAHEAQGDIPLASMSLQRALAQAEPEGYVRLFVDEGPAMAHLLQEAATRRIAPDYTGRLLAAFANRAVMPTTQAKSQDARAEMVEPLSPRELEVLQLIAQGLSNREIGERLFLALDTVKGHNRRIYGKLQAQSRTEAIARARELGLL